MIWRGLNKRTSPVSLPEGASPDTVNADHAGGKIGLLGARKGKTSFNSTGYAYSLTSLIPFRLPHANQLMLGRTDGTVEVISAPYTEPGASYDGVASRKELASNLSVTMTNPDEYAAVTVAWADGSSVGSNDIILIPAPRITLTGKIVPLAYAYVAIGGSAQQIIYYATAQSSTGTSVTMTPNAQTWIAIPGTTFIRNNNNITLSIEMVGWDDTTPFSIAVVGDSYALVYPNA